MAKKPPTPIRASIESLTLVSERVPSELRSLDRWVAWDGRLTPKGKVSKAPLNAATGGFAKTNKPETWSSFERAFEFARADARVGGLGLVLTNSDYWALDLDHVIDLDTGEVLPAASEFLATLGSTFIERSPSRDGLHVVFRGSRPGSFRRTKIKDAFGAGMNLEIFGGRSSRFLTMTGDVWGGTELHRASMDALMTVSKLHGKKTDRVNLDEFQPSADLDAEEKTVRRALRNVPSDDYDDWIRVGMALRGGLPEDEGFSIWFEWSSKAHNFDADACVYHWRSFVTPDGGVTLGTVFWLANQHEPGWRDAWRHEVAVGVFSEPSASSTYSADPAGARESAECWPEPEALDASAAPMPFPLAEAFPEGCRQLGEFVAAVAESYQVPPDLPAMLALAAFGLALSRTVEVQPQPGWREQLSLYILALLKSGERKSAVFGRVIGPIYDWQRTRAIALAGQIAIAENEIRVAEERLKRGRSKAATAKDDGDPVDLEALARELARLQSSKPVVPSLIATESTTEAIADLLVENDERGMLAAPEGDALDVMLGRYSQGKPNLGLWLSGHAGDSVEIRRKNRPTVRLQRPALTVALAVQPEAVSDLFESKAAAGRGLLARFFFSCPASKLGYRDLTPPSVPNHLVDWYGSRLHHLLDRKVPKCPTVLEFDSDASRLFLEFREQVEADLRPDGRFAERSAWGSKLAGAVARVAGILHGIAHPGLETQVITVETVRGALALAPYLDAHERDAVRIIDDDPAIRIAKRVLSWVRRQRIEQFSHNECFNAVRTSTLTKTSQIVPAVDLLVERGWLRRVQAPSDGRGPGRPPSPSFLVHPRAADISFEPHRQATQNTQNPEEGGGSGKGGEA